MSNYFRAIDRFAANLARGVITRRWLVLALSLALAMAADRTAARWSGALSGIATLEIPAEGQARNRRVDLTFR